MRKRCGMAALFSLVAAAGFALPPRSVTEIPVYQGATRDLAAEEDFAQFAAGVARIYRTPAATDQVFSFYEARLQANPETGDSGPPASSSPQGVTYSVDRYEQIGDNPPAGQVGAPTIREARFYWTVALKRGSVAEFAVDLLNASEEEASGGSRPKSGTRIAFSQVAVMAEGFVSPPEDDDKSWLASLPPPRIPELDRWRDVTVIRGVWAFQGSTRGAGPLVQGAGATGGSGKVELRREPIDRYAPSQLKFTGPIEGTANVLENVSFTAGAATESAGCSGALLGQAEGSSFMTVNLDLDDGTFRVELAGVVGGCPKAKMKVTGQDVSLDVDEAAFTVSPMPTDSPTEIPLDGYFLSLSSPVLVVAGHGLPLVGDGHLIVRLGRVPDGWYPRKKRPPEPPRETPPRKEPPKQDKDPNVLFVGATTCILHTEPDFLSDGVNELYKGTEVIVLDQKGYWYQVVVRKSNEVGWLNKGAVVDASESTDISTMKPLDASTESKHMEGVVIGGRG